MPRLFYLVNLIIWSDQRRTHLLKNHLDSHQIITICPRLNWRRRGEFRQCQDLKSALNATCVTVKLLCTLGFLVHSFLFFYWKASDWCCIRGRGSPLKRMGVLCKLSTSTWSTSIVQLGVRASRIILLHSLGLVDFERLF